MSEGLKFRAKTKHAPQEYCWCKPHFQEDYWRTQRFHGDGWLLDGGFSTTQEATHPNSKFTLSHTEDTTLKPIETRGNPGPRANLQEMVK